MTTKTACYQMGGKRRESVPRPETIEGAGESKRASFLSFEGTKGAKVSFSKCNSLHSERYFDTNEIS